MLLFLVLFLVGGVGRGTERLRVATSIMQCVVAQPISSSLDHTTAHLRAFLFAISLNVELLGMANEWGVAKKLVEAHIPPQPIVDEVLQAFSPIDDTVDLNTGSDSGGDDDEDMEFGRAASSSPSPLRTVVDENTTITSLSNALVAQLHPASDQTQTWHLLCCARPFLQLVRWELVLREATSKPGLMPECRLVSQELLHEVGLSFLY